MPPPSGPNTKTPVQGQYFFSYRLNPTTGLAFMLHSQSTFGEQISRGFCGKFPQYYAAILMNASHFTSQWARNSSTFFSAAGAVSARATLVGPGIPAEPPLRENLPHNFPVHVR